MSGENTARDYSKELGEARSLGNESLPSSNQLQSPSQFNVPQRGQADSHSSAPTSGAADNYNEKQNVKKDWRMGDNVPNKRYIDSNHKNEENNHSDRLAAARRGGASETAKVAKDLAEVATPMGAMSLLKQIDFIGDMPYIAAMGAALLKDSLDIIAFATVVLPVLFSALCTIFIFMMMLLVGANGKKKGASKLLSKVAILGAGGIVDSIPGIDFFPIETMTVIAIYVMELVERKNAPK